MIDGQQVRVEGPEGGRPILLIHGFGCSIHTMGRLAELLSDSFRIIRVELLGHGESATAADLDAPAQAAAIISILASLDAEDVVAVGHSFGADVAAELATNSDRVTGCVVIGQAPDYSYSKLPPGFITQILPIGWLHSLTPKAAVRFAIRSGFAPDFRVSASSDDDDAFVRDIAAMDPAMYKVVLETRPKRLAKLPLEVQIRESGVAALDIHGDKDLMWDWRKTVARFEAAGIRVETIAGAGHSPNVERPVTVARLIRQFATGPTPRLQPPA